MRGEGTFCERRGRGQQCREKRKQGDKKPKGGGGLAPLSDHPLREASLVAWATPNVAVRWPLSTPRLPSTARRPGTSNRKGAKDSGSRACVVPRCPAPTGRGTSPPTALKTPDFTRLPNTCACNRDSQGTGEAVCPNARRSCNLKVLKTTTTTKTQHFDGFTHVRDVKQGANKLRYRQRDGGQQRERGVGKRRGSRGQIRGEGKSLDFRRRAHRLRTVQLHT